MEMKGNRLLMVYSDVMKLQFTHLTPPDPGGLGLTCAPVWVRSVLMGTSRMWVGAPLGEERGEEPADER